MKNTSQIKSIKIKIILILMLIIYPSIILIFFVLNQIIEGQLLENYLYNDFYKLIQSKLFNKELLNNFDFEFTIWGQLTSVSVFKSFWFSLMGSLDSLSIIFVFMSHIVAFLVICFSSIYFDLSNIKNNYKTLVDFKLTLYSVVGMTVLMDLLFVTDNLLVIFFLAELSLLPLSFLMTKDNTIFWRNFNYDNVYENKRPLAFYYLVFFTVASGGFGFIGLLVIYFMFGTLSISELHCFEGITLNYYFDFSNILNEYQNNNLPFTSFSHIGLIFSIVCLLIWISVKVPLAPVHIWLPKAHVEGSTESSMLLAGIILKITVYVLLRISTIPVYALLLEYYRPYLLAIATTTAILGACGSLMTTDMKRITAYSSVSHMGIILVAGFFISSTATISCLPFIILLLTHTIVSTAMFMFIGCIYKSRYGQFISRNKLTYGGLLFIFPIYFLFGTIIFANLNIPLTIGFVGELGVLIVAVKAGISLGFILSFASFILLLPMLSMLGQVLLGPIRLIDFLKIKTTNIATNFITVFTKQLVFNKVVWSAHFSNFYLLNRIYFSFLFVLVLVFGIFIQYIIQFIASDLWLIDSIFLRV